MLIFYTQNIFGCGYPDHRKQGEPYLSTPRSKEMESIIIMRNDKENYCGRGMSECPLCTGTGEIPIRHIHFGDGVYKPEPCKANSGILEIIEKNKYNPVPNDLFPNQ